MFNDADKLPKDHFLCPGDLLTNSPEDKLALLDDKVTILHMYAVYHLFSLKDQKVVADRCLRLLRKDTGAPVLLLGGQVGSAKAGPFLRENVTGNLIYMYRHNEQSWKELWDTVCGMDEWKSKVKKLEVKSQILTLQSSGGKGRQATANAESGRQQLRHLFEVWVTFH
ncbi:uncharacterized protein BCR38DRAFT_481550 [Pseudomassariella vexata]|uniref:Uncharacterized protein n=1 Tax=Pseudomassariella vexata TaxID=1141098 RepID=A0A1Y2EFR1_9PEZI|nr:uncharacterized protein BCR38DRAFT_481550 [Pseudomassariella vexata]ORY70412.1 hypothetical protein BCR38DRAFT_481550 [Pseudomassariella vexata]